MAGIKKDIAEMMNVATETCIKFIKLSKKWEKDYEKYGTQALADGYQDSVDKAVGYFYRITEILDEAENGGYLSFGETKSLIKKKYDCKTKCLETFIKYGFDITPLMES